MLGVVGRLLVPVSRVVLFGRGWQCHVAWLVACVCVGFVEVVGQWQWEQSWGFCGAFFG